MGNKSSAPTSSNSASLSAAEIESRREISEICTFHPSNHTTVRFAYLNQRGLYPSDPDKPNQDKVTSTIFGDAGQAAFMGVFDGHGQEGHHCADFAKNQLPSLIVKYIAGIQNDIVKEARGEKDIDDNNSENDEARCDGGEANKTHARLCVENIEKCCVKAHLECNVLLRKDETIDDTFCGTTAISALFHDGKVTICNLGDSRAVIGKQSIQDNTGNLKAQALSRDQNCYRKDERERVKKAGGRILTMGQIDGTEPIHENWPDIELGDTIDEKGDPPRVWLKDKDYPGTAFTRSIGDSVSAEVGVYAEPEMTTIELEQDSKILVLASDGVFEFLTNQTVIDICSQFDDPLQACRELATKSFDAWLKSEQRTDDICVICMFIDSKKDEGSRETDNAKIVEETKATEGQKDVEEVKTADGTKAAEEARSSEETEDIKEEDSKKVEKAGLSLEVETIEEVKQDSEAQLVNVAPEAAEES